MRKLGWVTLALLLPLFQTLADSTEAISQTCRPLLESLAPKEITQIAEAARKQVPWYSLFRTRASQKVEAKIFNEIHRRLYIEFPNIDAWHASELAHHRLELEQFFRETADDILKPDNLRLLLTNRSSSPLTSIGKRWFYGAVFVNSIGVPVILAYVPEDLQVPAMVGLNFLTTYFLNPVLWKGQKNYHDVINAKVNQDSDSTDHITSVQAAVLDEISRRFGSLADYRHQALDALVDVDRTLLARLGPLIPNYLLYRQMEGRERARELSLLQAGPAFQSLFRYFFIIPSQSEKTTAGAEELAGLWRPFWAEFVRGYEPQYRLHLKAWILSQTKWCQEYDVTPAKVERLLEIFMPREP